MHRWRPGSVRIRGTHSAPSDLLAEFKKGWEDRQEESEESGKEREGKEKKRNKKAELSKGNRAMPQLFFSV